MCHRFFFFNDTATTEIYTRSIVGSVRCVQETGINAEYMGQHTMPALQESAIAVISVLAEVSADSFRRYYYNVIMPSLIQLMMHYKDPRYKRLKAQTIECITIISVAVGKELFRTFFPQVMEALVQFCLLYTSPSPRDLSTSRMPSSA
eukprot:TRINITY_DN51233_c0_g1_i2.p1 TRINITY_DN51233_c0_g1~~TRINITY_DN51233_c0_g1_i2.p1  ORF type:complete len:148 (+),score=36.75 TRINITY_DN51233_c0_g1_i2:50-493(+)